MHNAPMLTLAVDFDPIQTGIVILALVIGFVQFIREKIATARAEAEMREEIRRRGQQRSAPQNSPSENTNQHQPTAPKESVMEQLKRTLSESTPRHTSPLPSPGTPPPAQRREQPPRKSKPPTRENAPAVRPPSPHVTASPQPMLLEEASAYQLQSAHSEDGYLMDATSSRAKPRRPVKKAARMSPANNKDKASEQLIRQFLSNPASLRAAFLAKEIFGPPKGLQDD